MSQVLHSHAVVGCATLFLALLAIGIRWWAHRRARPAAPQLRGVVLEFPRAEDRIEFHSRRRG